MAVDRKFCLLILLPRANMCLQNEAASGPHVSCQQRAPRMPDPPAILSALPRFPAAFRAAEVRRRPRLLPDGGVWRAQAMRPPWGQQECLFWALRKVTRIFFFLTPTKSQDRICTSADSLLSLHIPTLCLIAVYKVIQSHK